MTDETRARLDQIIQRVIAVFGDRNGRDVDREVMRQCRAEGLRVSRANALCYFEATKYLQNCRNLVTCRKLLLEKYGVAPALAAETQHVAAMRDTEELLNDPVYGVNGPDPGHCGRLSSLTH